MFHYHKANLEWFKDVKFALLNRIKKLKLFLCPILFLGATIAQAQSGTTVSRVDAALDLIIPANARVEKLADGFGFTEGPVWHKEGYLLFSDIPKNTIYKWKPDGAVSVFLMPSGRSNGLTFDRESRLILCQNENRQLSRIEKDGTLAVLADKYKGEGLNAPNDIVCKSDGAIYFTDRPYGPMKKTELAPVGIYRFHKGKLELLEKDLTRPNGIAFSPDEKYLYFTDIHHHKPERLWMRYEVKEDGTLKNGKVFFDVTERLEDGSPDGMKVDVKGNLYCTGPGGVWIFSPQGKHLGIIRFPEKTTNCAWGDEDGKTLYITAGTGLYRIKLNIPGIRPY